MMEEWKDFFIKTWLNWPSFDPKDHESCPVLDGDDAKFGPASPHLPYRKAAHRFHETERLPTWQFGAESPDSSASVTLKPWVCP